jgi:hypothetical protein
MGGDGCQEPFVIRSKQGCGTVTTVIRNPKIERSTLEKRFMHMKFAARLSDLDTSPS